MLQLTTELRKQDLVFFTSIVFMGNRLVSTHLAIFDRTWRMVQICPAEAIQCKSRKLGQYPVSAIHIYLYSL